MNHLILKHIKSQKLLFCLAVFCGFLQNCSFFILSISIGQFFNLKYGIDGNKSRILNYLHLNLNTSYNLSLLFGFLIVLKFVALYFEKRLSFKLTESLTKKLRESLFAFQIFQGSEHFNKKKYGKYLLRYAGDMNSITKYLSVGIIGFSRDLLYLLTALVFLFSINFTLTSLLVGFSAIFYLSILIFTKSEKTKIVNKRNAQSESMNFITNSLSNHRKIKLNNTENEQVIKFKLLSNKLSKLNFELNASETIKGSLPPIFHYILISITMFYLYKCTNIVYTDSLVYVFILMMLGGTFRRIMKVPSILNKGNISLVKFDEMEMLQKTPTFEVLEK